MSELPFTAELNDLRKFEDYISRHPGSRSYDEIEKTLAIISALKESVYVLRMLAGKTKIQASYRYQKFLGEFSPLVNRVEVIIERVPNTAVLDVLYEETNDFFKQLEDLSRISEDQGQSVPNVQALDKDVVALQKMLYELREEVRQTQDEARRTNERIRAAENEAQNATKAATEMAGTKIADGWTEEYLPYISRDDTTTSLISKYKEKVGDRHNQLLVLLYRLSIKIYGSFRKFFIDELFYEGKSYVNSSNRWRIWRAFWLFVLLALSVAYLLFFWSYDINAGGGVINFIVEKSIFLPLLVVVSLGFTFSAKNYRISCHLLEQYRHRYVVARMMRHLISLDELASKSELLQDGSKVLFEFRTTGYMNKADSETIPLKDILDLARQQVGK